MIDSLGQQDGFDAGKGSGSGKLCRNVVLLLHVIVIQSQLDIKVRLFYKYVRIYLSLIFIHYVIVYTKKRV